jgi:hypothetical protein
VRTGRITGLTLMIGTYEGAARGQLNVQLCQGGRCAQGQAALAGATDNADLLVPLATPLDVTAGQDLTYRIESNAGAGRPPALWLWPLANDATSRAPRLSLRYAPAPDAPARVYADATVAIWRISNPAPYFDAASCQLAVVSRTRLTTNCPAPARLLRRELAYPGWQAWRDGQAVPVTTDGIFQSVALPAGTSNWRFSYAPPHSALAWAASAIGAAALALFWWRGRSSGRRAMIGRSTNRLIA